MKNLGICLSGSLRSIENCYSNFINNIILPNKDKYNIHLFYYLPLDNNVYKSNLLKNDYTEIKINKDIELPKIHVIWGGNPVTTIKDNCSKGGINGYLFQLHGIEQSFKMLINFEEKNNINFDIILRCRHDVIFKNELHLDNYIMDKLYIPLFHGYDGINDRFAFGPKNLMSHYMYMYTNIYNKKYEQTNIGKAEKFCKTNLDDNDVPFILIKDILFNRIRMDGTIIKDSF